MTIKRQLAIYLFVPYLLLSAILFIFASNLVVRGFNEVEQSEARDDIDRVHEIISTELQFMKDQANNWGAWDDAYDWVATRRTNFIKNNLLAPSAFDLHFDYILITDQQKKVIANFKYNQAEKSFASISEDDKSLIKNKILLPFLKTNLDVESGFVPLTNDGWIFGVRKITNNERYKSSNGNIVFIRNLKSNFLPKINEIMKTQIDFHPNSDISNASLLYVNAISDETLELRYSLNTNSGEKAGFLSFKKPRTIFQTGQRVFTKLVVAMEGSVLFIGLIIYFALLISVVHRLNKLNEGISNIQKSEHLNDRLDDKNEDEISDLAEAMNRMLDRIANDQVEINKAARVNSLNHLASGVAHEINNPLNIILGSASLLGRKIEALTSGENLSIGQIHKELEDMKRFSGKIKVTAVRIAHIVQSLRSLAKEDYFEESQITTSKKLVEVAMSLCEARLKENDIKIEVEFGPEDLQFLSRPVQLNKVLLILISNCFDAVAEMEEKWIKISFIETDSSVKILISDSGKKISAETEQKLFTPFFSTKPIGSGTGLGLSVARGLIESQNGKLIFDQTQKNTCFVIELPKVASSSSATA